MSEIVCPSGLAGVIRKLKVREENILTDSKRNRSGKSLDEVLNSIWMDTLEIGPYGEIMKGTRPDFGRVLIGDHTYVTMEMRRITFGDDYAFRVQCTNPFCRAPFDWEVQLSKLKVKKLSDEDRAVFMAGNRFETQLSDGRKVFFKLLTSDAQRQFRKARREEPDRLSTAAMRLQLLEVEGVEKRALKDFIDDMDSDDADGLRMEFEKHDCGVETSIEIQCPECETIGDIELPFGGPGFFKRKREKTSQEEASA